VCAERLWRCRSRSASAGVRLPGRSASKRGFGRSGNDRDLGLFLHPTIAVDAVHGGVIGLVGAQVLNRTGDKVDTTKQRAIEDKESYRWLVAAEEASDVLAGAACNTVAADRRVIFSSSSPGVPRACSS
jgi:hypothetical protein